MVTRGQWLIIVRRDANHVYGEARARFGSLARVIIDRRETERRRVRVPIASDRRQADRRQAPPSQEQARWQRFGHQVLYRPDGIPRIDGREARTR